MANTRKKAAGGRAKAKSAKPKPAVKTSVKTKPGKVAGRTSASGPKLPRYDQLPIRPGAPKGAAWGVFGDDDELGTVNLLTPQRVMQAAAEIRRGMVFPLNLPINIPDPPLFGRGAHRHTIFPIPQAEFFLDDYLDNFYPQASSQWDAVGHIKHPLHGAYNGLPDHEVTGRGGTRLGIDNLARHGIVGRGVLADIARFYERRGREIRCNQAEVIPLDDLEATLAEQKTRLRPGDVLLMRTGWTKSYLASGPEIKAGLTQNMVSPGIESSTNVAKWLWDNGIAAVASDSPGFEVVGAAPVGELLHPYLLAFLGMPIGEMWDMEALADDCAADKRYTFFLTSAPLNIPGGVGSPPNALAIK